MIFGLTLFGMHDLWLLLSCVGGQQKVTSLPCQPTLVWIDYVDDIITQLM
jgi:hypothetical protein